MKNRLSNHAGRGAFTLIELVVVVAIVGMLVTLAMPAFGRMQDRAKSTACAANLRSLGVAVLSFAQDNDNRLPIVEGYPSNPIYTGEQAAEAQTLIEAFGPYGLTQGGLKCPADQEWFAAEGTSYLWKPTLDEELVNNPVIYGRRGQRFIPSQYASLCTDFEAVHGPRGGKRTNRLYLDGHVKTFY